MEENQQLLIEIMKLADRVTLARLGLLQAITAEHGEPKAEAIRYELAARGEWENYPAYFRQTFAYIAASVRDGYATLDAPAQVVDIT